MGFGKNDHILARIHINILPLFNHNPVNRHTGALGILHQLVVKPVGYVIPLRRCQQHPLIIGQDDLAIDRHNLHLIPIVSNPPGGDEGDIPSNDVGILLRQLRTG